MTSRPHSTDGQSGTGATARGRSDARTQGYTPMLPADIAANVRSYYAPPGSRRPTLRQAEVLWFIYQSFSERGYGPTFREMAARLGIRSTNGVNDHLRALERKGLIRIPPVHKNRAIVVTPAGHACLGVEDPGAGGRKLREMRTRAPTDGMFIPLIRCPLCSHMHACYVDCPECRRAA